METPSLFNRNAAFRAVRSQRLEARRLNKERKAAPQIKITAQRLPNKEFNMQARKLPPMQSSFRTEFGNQKKAVPQLATHFLAVIVWSACFFPGCSSNEPTKQKPTQSKQLAPIPHAIAWLMVQQQPDHLWRSEYYGNLKGGAAITALVLYALAHSDPQAVEPHRDALQAACDALVPEIQRRGYVSNPDGPDYPTYASAMLLVAVERLKLRLPDESRDHLTAYLLDSQIDQAEGYSTDDPDFGGWDMLGSTNGPRKTTGTNISVGATVAEALANSESPGAKTALRSYRDWLTKCQNLSTDGGFYFHATRAHDGNKAGWHDESEQAARTLPRSYGTATADGLRSLKACGVSTDDEAFQKALAWLQLHPSIDAVPGFESSSDKSWTDGLLFYYLYALSKTLDDLPPEARDSAAVPIRDHLIRQQNPDGSWQNSSSRMREDDPLIATCFALIVLSQAERVR